MHYVFKPLCKICSYSKSMSLYTSTQVAVDNGISRPPPADSQQDNKTLDCIGSLPFERDDHVNVNEFSRFPIYFPEDVDVCGKA